MGFEVLEDKRIYQRAELVADSVWDLCEKRGQFARNTFGSQLVRSADSVGANIAEAAGRFFPADVCKFFYYARGSLYETKYWLRRAVKRRTITEEQLTALMVELDQLGREINSSIGFQRTRDVKSTNRGSRSNRGDTESTNDPTT